MYAIVEFVHSGGAGHRDNLAPLCFRDSQELLHFIGVSGAGGAQNDRALLCQILNGPAVFQAADHRLVQKHRLAPPDKRHGAAQVVVPITALNEADVAHLRQFLQAAAALLQLIAPHEALHLGV